jgi:protein tyrosine/serine phosphatase
LQGFFLQFAFLYAPLVHSPTEKVTPFLYRGHDPSTKEIKALHDLGIKTIVSLRTNPQSRKRRLCQKLGMDWVLIKTGVFLTPTFSQLDEFRAIVNDPASHPCYVCCEIDMDRTSVYIGAYRMVDQNWTAEQMRDELEHHHPKRWWPTFRKYERIIIAYARDRQMPKLETK